MKANKDYQHEWFLRNRQKQIDKVRLNRQKVRVWIREYKSRLSCQVCGESRAPCLDFHHTEEKDGTLASVIARGWSIERIEREIAKCVVLCANCHRMEHSGQ